MRRISGGTKGAPLICFISPFHIPSVPILFEDTFRALFLIDVIAPLRRAPGGYTYNRFTRV